MTTQWVIQIAIYLALLLTLSKPAVGYLTGTYQGEPTWLGRLFGPLERLLCRLAGVPSGPGPLPVEVEMSLPSYGLSLLVWNGAGVVVTYVLEHSQTHFPQAAVARVWVQSFVSATTALAVLTVLIRGLGRKGVRTLGNFWVDLIRGTLYVLLPLALLLTLLLICMGTVPALAEWLAARLRFA